MTDAGVGAASWERLVALPLGTVRVRVDRRGLGLGERGGFEAAWAPDPAPDPETPPISREAFHRLVREHLRAVARLEQGRTPPKITLNLAAHQLVDDVEGWSRLNWRG